MDAILLELGELSGSSQIEGFDGKIELLSYSHGVAMQVTNDISNKERTSGKPMHQDFHLTKYIDPTTPVLNQHCCEGKVFTTAKITVARNDNGELIPLIIYDLTNVVISGISVGGGSGDKPVENFSLNYAGITWEFWPQKPEGGKEGAITATWDQTKNKAD